MWMEFSGLGANKKVRVFCLLMPQLFGRSTSKHSISKSASPSMPQCNVHCVPKCLLCVLNPPRGPCLKSADSSDKNFSKEFVPEERGQVCNSSGKKPSFYFFSWHHYFTFHSRSTEARLPIVPRWTFVKSEWKNDEFNIIRVLFTRRESPVELLAILKLVAELTALYG